ncbi:MAG: hypothetical protein LBR82_08520 [Desulfovibrio sp.]|jgi:pentapeptide MXKDX repeat protein|nr:hypothetical protein [Desulfovibrio sp.]
MGKLLGVFSATVVICALSFTSLFAADTGKSDAMRSPGTVMKDENMKKDDGMMKKDDMGHGKGMKKDGMRQDGTMKNEGMDKKM